jgi:hypothetical protein
MQSYAEIRVRSGTNRRSAEPQTPGRLGRGAVISYAGYDYPRKPFARLNEQMESHFGRIHRYHYDSTG